MKKREEPDFAPIHVLICGDRNWNDDYIVTILIAGLKLWHGLNIHIWHGDARGADSLAKVAATQVSGFNIHPFPADWDEGRSAGPRRNQRMIRTMLAKAAEDPSSMVMAVAFNDDLAASKGTKDVVKRLLKAEIPVYCISRPILEDFRG